MPMEKLTWGLTYFDQLISVLSSKFYFGNIHIFCFSPVWVNMFEKSLSHHLPYFQNQMCFSI